MTVKEITKIAEARWEECHGCDENDKNFWMNGFITGYLIAENENIVGQEVGHNVQVERMYSEEEVLKLLITFSDDRTFLKKDVAVQWFEQFKKQ
jgi:poly(3-hydroxybutyrate) depolymerase